MRAPFQILAVPYRFIKGELCFCIFHRADSGIWQFIAGGGENNEKPSDAALREIKEESGVTAKKLTELKSVAFICNANPTISREHSEYQWLPYNDARKLLKWDSNKVAMYETKCLLENKQ